MAKLDALYRYQQADIEIDKFEAGLRATPAYKRYAKLRAFMDEQRKTLQKMTDGIETHTKQAAAAEQRCQTLNDRFSEGEQKVQTLDQEDLAEVERYRKYFEQLSSKLNQEKSELAESVAVLETEEKQLNEIRSKLTKVRKEYDEAQEQIEAERAAIKDELDALVSAAKQVEKDVDKALIDAYKTAKRSHSMPVAVVADGRCLGCMMQLPTVAMRRLKEDKEVVYCESCGRMLYAKEM